MANLTWVELEGLIDKYVKNKDDEVLVYDMSTGEEMKCDIVQFNETLMITIKS
jgi:RecB family exonuclease